jgi:His-Xaa-Ser system protein (TIGR03982 family)
MIKTISLIIIALFSLLWIIKEVLFPITIAALYSKEYMDLAYKCDTAMESSWYNSQNKPNDKSEKIQMLDCHEYDKTRKILLMSGLPDSYTSWLGLKTLDLYQRPAEEYVEKHRFKEK